MPQSKTYEDHPNYLQAMPQVLAIHQEAADFAVFVNEEIATANGGVLRYPLCGTALYSTAADQLSLHRAIRDLCDHGWAAETLVLVRTMLDIYLSVLVLVERESEADFRGVKYTHGFLKAIYINKNSTPAERANAKEQILEVIARAPAGIKEQLKSYFFKETLGAYWYCPDYNRPSDILSKLSTGNMGILYDYFSGAVHGSYMGLRILKDKPDEINPNPRADPRAQNLSLSISTRLLLESTYLRDLFENAASARSIEEEIVARLTKMMEDPAFKAK
jgi:hypothetical protein